METKISHQLVAQAISAVSEKLFDKNQQIHLAFACLLANGHLLIEDKPGLGKTTLANAMAQVLGLKFSRIQFTSDMLPSDVLGVSIFQRDSSEFKFFPGPVFTQLLLADELNRGTPRTQSALLEAMAEKQVTVDGKTYKLQQPFFVIATQNPQDEAGTFPLPDSQLDRFHLSVSLGYPSQQAERKLYDENFATQHSKPLESMISMEQLAAMQAQIQTIHANDEVKDYLQLLISKTREHANFTNGLSPRAGLSLFRVAQALAYIDGRDFLIPDDIKKAFVPVALHRLRSHASESSLETLLNQLINDTSIT